MPDRSSKRNRKRLRPGQGPEDVNEIAAGILAAIPGALEDEPDPGDVDDADPAKIKEAAASLGRRGGLKGGKARAEKLSPEKRSAIAKKAAVARWSHGPVKKT